MLLLFQVTYRIVCNRLIQRNLRSNFDHLPTFTVVKRSFSKKFRNVTHVIFDMDGLLIESVYHRVLEDIAKQFGKKYTEKCKVRILGVTEKDTARIVIEEMQLKMTSEEFLTLFRKKVKEALHSPHLMPGVRDLSLQFLHHTLTTKQHLPQVRHHETTVNDMKQHYATIVGAKEIIIHFHKTKVPMGVATSSTRPVVDKKISKHKALFNLISHITCGGSDPAVKRGKPAPDVFLVCASRFPDKPCPEKCLVFEDAPNGVKGATEAGMQTVLVPPKVVGMEQRKLATIWLDSLSDFQPELFGLPSKPSN